GDARYTSFKDIWLVERKKVVEKLNPSIDCKNLHCIRHETNLELEKIIMKKRVDLDGIVKEDEDLFI
ncbi:hypothetical protein N9T83_01920, partial [Candidatus Pelagibacter sp.]